MISLVITSCGRVELLKRTFSSFMRCNDVPVNQIVLVEDSANKKVEDEIVEYFKQFNFDDELDIVLYSNKQNKGQIPCIDFAYSKVTQPYVFHLENDWEFIRPGFMSKSLDILEQPVKILQVWLRGLHDTNTHGIEPTVYTTGKTDYRYMITGALGGSWHGFSWNPGLRRLKDYELIKPFTSFIQEGDFNALTECRIGQKYYREGFRAVTLLDQYCKHIG